MRYFPIKAVLAGAAAPGTKVTVRGWVRTRRDSKAGLSFIHLNDGSSLANLQVIVEARLANYRHDVLRAGTGCAIVCDGIVQASPGRGQAFEVLAERLELVGEVADPESYPIQPKQHSFEFLREVAHLRPRTNTFGALSRVRHRTAMAIHRYFTDHGYYWINTPIITASDAEGAGQMFRVSTLDPADPPRVAAGAVDYSRDFFGRETFLTVSGQLNVEAYCLALSKVYTFGPTFRAENSNTARHLAEFWMVEPEIAFADLDDLADLAEDFLKVIFRTVLAECPEDMRFFAERIEPEAVSRLERLIEQPFQRLDYGEAIAILQRAGQKFEFPVTWGVDLQTEHERYLSETHCRSPVIVMNYPAAIKAFYMRQNDDGRTVAALDILAPGIGEIIGGSQREERFAVLESRMRDQGLDLETYRWYLDLRRYGSVPHAGFGLGFERLLSYITGLANIRDVIPYPRTPGNAGF